MRKLSRLLVMVVVMLAVITMTFNVNAGTQELSDYFNTSHEINGMKFELEESEQDALIKYIDQYVDDVTADSILDDIEAVEKMIKNTNATNIDDVDKTVMKSAMDIVKKTCIKAGLTLSANTTDKTYQITKNSDGTVLTSGSYKNKITSVGSAKKETSEDVISKTQDKLSGNTKEETKKDTNKDEAKKVDNTTKANTTKNTNTADKTLLYTGSNTSLYVVAILVIIAIAVVAKKRA